VLSVNHCSSEETTIHSVCVLELHVTVSCIEIMCVS